MQFSAWPIEGQDREGQQDPDQDCEELRVSSSCTLVIQDRHGQAGCGKGDESPEASMTRSPPSKHCSNNHHIFREFIYMPTYTSFDEVGIKEHVSNVISNLTPRKTPFQSGIGDEKVTQPLFQWQEDSLRAVADNAAVEGADADLHDHRADRDAQQLDADLPRGNRWFRTALT
jgi:hypothetical protein